MSWSRARLSVLVLLAAALVLSVAAGVRPTVARADGPIIGSPCVYDPTQCTPAEVRLLGTGYIDPAYQMSGDQRTALASLEDIAVDTVIRRHGLEPDDTDRVRMRLWNRPEIRLELLGEIVVAGSKAPAARSGAESAALEWFASVQQRRNVQVAQAAKTEYEKFFGATAYQGGKYPENSCTYVPPAPYAAEYPGEGLRRWPACYGVNPGPLDLGPRVPSADDFTRWGNAAVAGGEFTADGVYLSSLLGTYGIGLLSAASVVSASVAAVAALPAATTLALLQTIAPFVIKAASTAPVLASQTSYVAAALIEGGASLGSSGGATAGAAGSGAATVSFGAGAALGVAAVVIVALTLAITAILQVVDAGNVGQTLVDNLAKARVTPVDPVAAMNAPGGLALLVQAVEGVTLNRDLAVVRGVDAYLPTPGGDTVLQVTGARGAPAGPQRTTRFQFTSPGTATTYGLGDVTFAHGWWVDNNPDPAKRVAPSQALDLYLSDPNPVTQNGIVTDRPAFAYPARVTTIQQDGRLRFLVTQPSRPGNPGVGGSCSDLSTDHCWITDTLPTLDANGAPRRQTVSLIPNTIAAFDVTGTSGVNQHVPATFVAQRFGAPYTADGDGDPVTVTWTAAPCRARVACPEVRTGPTQGYTFTTEGRYSFTVTATDALGASTSRTVDVDVANGPAVFGVDDTSVAGTVGNAVTLGGPVTDGPLYRPEVTVDWGDGSAPTTRSAFGTWSSQHAYARAGTYTATVTVFDGTLTSAPRTVSVTIASTPPRVTLDAAAKTPAAWTNLAPGTTIRVTGSVADPDPDEAVTLHVHWYDGTDEDLPLTRTGNGAATFALSHVVRRGSGIQNAFGLLVAVTASDSAGGTSQGSVGVAGNVLDAAPSLTGLRYDGGITAGTTTVTGTTADANGTRPTIGVLWGDGTDDPDQLLGQPFPVAGDGSFTATHTYAAAGVYTATVISADNGLTGNVVRKTLTVYVFDQTRAIKYVTWKNPPVAGQVSTIELGVDVPEAGGVHITWGPGPTGEGYSDVDLRPGYQVVTADHVFGQAWGGGIVSLYVTYGALGDGGRFDVPDPIAANPAPNLADLAPVAGRPGTPVGITVVYDDLGADVDTVALDWGDGSTVQQSTVSPADPSRLLTHTYGSAGVYRPSVTLTDLVGNAVTKTTTAVIGDNPPVLGPLTVTPAPEGSATTVSATAVDPVGGDARLRVDWGDGTNTVSDPATTAGARTASHTYADDGRYTVSVVALNDADEPSPARSTIVAVRNAAPTVAPTAPATVVEGSEVTVSLVVTDPGANDTGTATVDWGDGTSTAGLPWTATARTVEARHVYVDDDPSGTARNRKRIAVVVVDNAGAARQASTGTTVVNVAPTATVLLRDAAGRALPDSSRLPAGSLVTAEVQVADPGVTDTHTATVGWGDGSSTTAPVVAGVALARHTYRAAGARRIEVGVTDDDRGAVSAPARTLTVGLPAASATAAATALRAIAAGTLPARVPAALRTASKLLVGPAASGGTSVVAALRSGDPAAALELLGQVTTQLRTAATYGAPPAVQDQAVALALLARAVAASAIAAAATADPAAQPVVDAGAALGAVDQALVAGDLAAAVLGAAHALVLLTPPPA